MTDLANNNPLFYNSALLFSQESMEKLKNAKIALAGLGGIGSITLEMLVRSGIENFKIADYDKYSKENLNRQLFATVDTIGKNKALVAKERMLKINPSCNIEVFKDGVTDTQIENLQVKIYNGKATRADITRVTKRLGDDIAGVYGFSIPKQRQPNEQAR